MKCDLLVNKYQSSYVRLKVSVNLSNLKKTVNSGMWPDGAAITRFFPHERNLKQTLNSPISLIKRTKLINFFFQKLKFYFLFFKIFCVYLKHDQQKIFFKQGKYRHFFVVCKYCRTLCNGGSVGMWKSSQIDCLVRLKISM